MGKTIISQDYAFDDIKFVHAKKKEIIDVNPLKRSFIEPIMSEELNSLYYKGVLID